MATTAANFYFTSQAKPSIFEIIAQNNLNQTLQPALEVIAKFLASSNRRCCAWMLKYFDEVFLCLNGFLQIYYFRKHGASFSEHFYALKRQRLSDQEMSQLQTCLSWAHLVIGQYLYKKFKDRIINYRLLDADQLLIDDPNRKIKKSLIYLHDGFEMTWALWMFMNGLRYMSEKNEFQMPHLQLLNLKLVYTLPNKAAPFWSFLLSGKLSFTEFSEGLLNNAVQSILEISAFFIQFLQTWNAEKLNFSMSSLPCIKPPEPHRIAHEFQGKCPICLLNWKIPTVLPVSGYVYCFSCIYKYLRENEKCPVTQLPSKPLEIIRLYQ